MKRSKVCHKEWRREAKKLRRKKHRQLIAKERDRLLDDENAAKLKEPNYLTLLANERLRELIEEENEDQKRQETHKLWQDYEVEVIKRWNEKQKRLAVIEEAKQKEKQRIQQEFEANEKRLRDIENEQIEKAKEKQRQQLILTQKIDEYILGNIDLPDELTGTADTNPTKALCPFFVKTSSCRFGDKCSRNHSRPNVSSILLVPHFFTHIRLDQSKPTEYGSDLMLEFDDEELYRAFLDFFNDVVPEFEKFGTILQFRVCYNQEPHLRGHVYIEYNLRRDSVNAYRSMQGRYYAGKMLNLEFCYIPSWKAAICGLAFRNRCSKGRNCNFLHVFKNPNNRFPIQSQSPYVQKLLKRNENSKPTTITKSWDDDDNEQSTSRNWRWSESPPNTAKEKSRNSVTSSKSRSRNSYGSIDRNSQNRRSYDRYDDSSRSKTFQERSNSRSSKKRKRSKDRQNSNERRHSSRSKSRSRRKQSRSRSRSKSHRQKSSREKC